MYVKTVKEYVYEIVNEQIKLIEKKKYKWLINT